MLKKTFPLKVYMHSSIFRRGKASFWKDYSLFKNPHRNAEGHPFFERIPVQRPILILMELLLNYLEGFFKWASSSFSKACGVRHSFARTGCAFPCVYFICDPRPMFMSSVAITS